MMLYNNSLHSEEVKAISTVLNRMVEYVSYQTAVNLNTNAIYTLENN